MHLCQNYYYQYFSIVLSISENFSYSLIASVSLQLAIVFIVAILLTLTENNNKIFLKSCLIFLSNFVLFGAFLSFLVAIFLMGPVS